MKKKRFLIFLALLLIIAIGVLIYFLLIKNSNNKELIPYVEEHNIMVYSAKKEFTLPVSPYSKDTKGNLLENKAIKYKDTEATYSFSDYSVSKSDDEGYSTYTFKINTEVPVTFTVDSSKKLPNYKYTYMYVQPAVFDYYTGDLCKEKNSSKNGSVNYYEIENPKVEDMNYTEITWKDKTYLVGVKMESASKWTGLKNTSKKNNIYTYKDTNKVTTKVTIYAPTDYDGLMLSLRKKGSSKQDLLDQLEYNNEYNKLLKQAEKTGKKSDELIEMEYNNTKVFKLLESRYKNGKDFKNDDFYVIRINDIVKAK